MGKDKGLVFGQGNGFPELDSTCMDAEEVLAAIETIVKERNA